LCCTLFGWETLCVELQERHGQRVLESGMQGEVFGCKENEVTGDWRKLKFRSLIICTSGQILLG